MRFVDDCTKVRDTLRRDPTFAGMDLSASLEGLQVAETRDDFLLSAMKVLARGGNGHSRIIPNGCIRVWPVRIVSHGDGFGIVRDGRIVPLERVNGAPVDAVFGPLRPLLAGTAARQSVIGGILLAWPAALGVRTVTYGLADRDLCFGPDDLVPALPLYPVSDAGMPEPGVDLWAGRAPAAWTAPVWTVRIARLDVPLPPGVAETVLARPEAGLLFDLRGNTGGDFTRMIPVIEALRDSWRGARCAVLVDRFTFSAAIVAAVLLQHHLGARLFGEAMGDSLQFWAEGGTVDLPQSGAHLRWSSAWHDWETGQADATTPPEIARHMVATGPLRITPDADGSSARAWVAG